MLPILETDVVDSVWMYRKINSLYTHFMWHPSLILSYYNLMDKLNDRIPENKKNKTDIYNQRLTMLRHLQVITTKDKEHYILEDRDAAQKSLDESFEIAFKEISLPHYPNFPYELMNVISINIRFTTCLDVS